MIAVVIDDCDDLVPLTRRRHATDHLYWHHGLSGILLRLLEGDGLTETVTTMRAKGKVMQALVHPVIPENVDFAPVLTAFQSLTPGQRIVWLAIAAAMVRVRMGRWEQRTHANGKPKRYTEEEVSRHYSISARAVYKAWMHADNVMGRAFRQIEWQFRRDRGDV